MGMTASGEKRGKESGGAIDKVSRTPEIGGFEARELSVITNRNQFSQKEENHLNWIASEGGAEKLAAYVDSVGEIDLIRMFVVGVLRHGSAVDNSVGKVVSNQPGPDFLKHKGSLGSMKFGEANGVFERSERGFLVPSFMIEGFDVFRGELVSGEIGDH